MTPGNLIAVAAYVLLLAWVAWHAFAEILDAWDDRDSRDDVDLRLLVDLQGWEAHMPPAERRRA